MFITTKATGTVPGWAVPIFLIMVYLKLAGVFVALCVAWLLMAGALALAAMLSNEQQKQEARERDYREILRDE